MVTSYGGRDKKKELALRWQSAGGTQAQAKGMILHPLAPQPLPVSLDSMRSPRQLGAVDLEGADEVCTAEEEEGERRQRVAVCRGLELKRIELPVVHGH